MDPSPRDMPRWFHRHQGRFSRRPLRNSRRMTLRYEHRQAIEDRDPVRQTLAILSAAIQMRVLEFSNLQNL